ncbi:MAG: cytochrome c [Cytophagales bacterium]|nr:MAG: cytochrome c [Cytophagales bacterium]TAF60494.1 MAG: cytochrome c [Cytophagales bacterium]
MLKQIFIAALTSLTLFGCAADGNYPGVEYAPQMYHTVAYDPLSQITESRTALLGIHDYYSNAVPINDYGMNPAAKVRQNMISPVAGTVARQYYTTLEMKDTVLFYDNIHKDSIDMSARLLKNPLPDNEQILAQGKTLYISYCSPCHGETGAGDGKVGEVYKGVPNYSTGRYATLNEGHIFHVITHGKNTMWPHKSLVTTEERWKIVRYVQKLQKGEN